MERVTRGAPLTRLVESLPATIPFVGPEALERQSGRPMRLRLGANESAFGPSPSAREAMRAAVDRVAWYADPECYELLAALARQHGVGIEHIVVVRAFVAQGETVVTSLGGYPTFNYHVAGYGGSLQRVPDRDFRNDLDGLA